VILHNRTAEVATQVLGRRHHTEGSGAEQPFEKHRAMMFRIAIGVLRDRDAAEDVCQQALLQLWRQNGALRDPSAAGSWLAKAVMNESLQVLRRRQIERRALVEHTHQAAAAPERAVHDPAMRESVLLALEKLPEMPRLVVTLRIMQGMSGNEVSELLGCSAGEVSRQLHRGMEQLRGLLVEWKEDV
jgi:RNA polymerase sigma-70 factor, ECF subfamily